MADGAKSDDVSKNLGKVVQKTFRRTKEKMLESMGKADRTPDNEFDALVLDFQKQQVSAAKLQKELKNYINSVKAMALASSSLHATVGEVYEASWPGYSDIAQYSQRAQPVWDRHIQTLMDYVFRPLIDYVQRFAEFKSKISKRSRKLVDVDSSRHSVDMLHAAKRPDNDKLVKAEDDLREKKRVFGELNSELTQRLPSFYAERISVTAYIFGSLFRAEAKLYEELTKIDSKLSDVTAKRTGKMSGSTDNLAQQTPPRVEMRTHSASVSSQLSTTSIGGTDSPTSQSANSLASSRPQPQQMSSLRTGYKNAKPSTSNVLETPKAAPVAKDDLSDEEMPKFRILHKTPSAADAFAASGMVNKQLKPAASATTVSSAPPLTLPKPAMHSKPPIVSSESSSIHTLYQTESVRGTKVSTSSSIATTPESPDNVPTVKLLRQKEAPQSEAARKDTTNKRRSTEPSIPALVLPTKGPAVVEEDVPKYRILGKTRELVDSSPAVSEGSDSDDSDLGANLPEFKMLKESSMSFGASSASKPKGKSASFGKADKSAKGDIAAELDAMVPGTKGRASAKKDSKGKGDKKPAAKNNANFSEQLYKAPQSNEAIRVPSHILFQVKAIYAYDGEDLDELSFDAGDLIDVIPFPDPEDQDDGWLMGVKLATGERGVFPENFTTRIK